MGLDKELKPLEGVTSGQGREKMPKAAYFDFLL